MPLLIWILIATYIVFSAVLNRTRFGRWIYLVGGNPTAPFRAGIDVDRVLYKVFILSGVLAAFAGWLLAARTNGATPNLGIGMLFEAFAAVVIGGVPREAAWAASPASSPASSSSPPSTPPSTSWASMPPTCRSSAAP